MGTGFGTERLDSLMAKNIYVGNLAWSVTSDDLRELFSQFGTVTKAEVIADRETGRSRGFGFVEMSSDEEAQKAIEALNGSTHSDRPLTVNIAREREDRGGGRGGFGGGGGRRGGGGGGGGYGGGSDRGRRY
jgi:RNA recognition motif-containing protein